MATDRHLQELAARCVDCMVFYQNGHRTPKAKALMVSEVRAVARSLAGLKLNAEVRFEHLDTPVRDGLVARYGPESGQSLFREFLAAFDWAVVSEPVLATTRV